MKPTIPTYRSLPIAARYLDRPVLLRSPIVGVRPIKTTLRAALTLDAVPGATVEDVVREEVLAVCDDGEADVWYVPVQYTERPAPAIV